MVLPSDTVPAGPGSQGLPEPGEFPLYVISRFPFWALSHFPLSSKYVASCGEEFQK